MARPKKTNEQKEFDSKLCRRIAYARQGRYSAQEFAEAIGTSYENVRKYDSGDSPIPLYLLPKISETDTSWMRLL